MLLDLGLPDKDGMEVLTTLRNAGNQVPVVIVTARDQFDDRTSATLSVSDTGPGIAPADHLRVVEPFYRGLDNTAAGSGLGLPIVQAIATRYSTTASLCYALPQQQSGLRATVALPLAPCSDGTVGSAPLWLN